MHMFAGPGRMPDHLYHKQRVLVTRAVMHQSLKHRPERQSHRDPRVCNGHG